MHTGIEKEMAPKSGPKLFLGSQKNTYFLILCSFCKKVVLNDVPYLFPIGYVSVSHNYSLLIDDV